MADGTCVNSRDFDERTPLHCATNYGHLKIVQLLISKGADCNATTSYLWTALHIAASVGDEGVARTLISAGCDPEIQDYGGRTALHIACLKGNKEVVDLLVSSGCILEVRTTRLNMSPLLEALSFGHTHVARSLLRAGCNPRVKDRGEVDSLMYALNYQHNNPRTTDLLEELLTNGARLHKRHIQYIHAARGNRAEELMSFLEPYIQQPLPLKHLSRSLVRRQLFVASGERSILPNVKVLPIPRQLQIFLGQNEVNPCCTR